MTATTLCFLHTAAQHVPTFEALVQARRPGLRLRHVVMPELLAEAQAGGAEAPALVTRVQEAMRAAAALDAAPLVVCTCSTIGGAAEHTDTGGRFVAQRIDRAMADLALATGPRVLIAAALQSTLAPTLALLQQSAQALRRPLAERSLWIDGAWAHFLAGDTCAYAAAIASALRGAQADVVVLAQASMAPAAVLLADLGPPVLSSPALGVERALAHLAELEGVASQARR